MSVKPEKMTSGKTKMSKKCVLVDQPNTDVLLEVIGCRPEGSGSRYFRKRLFFAFRPMMGEDFYLDGSLDMPATVSVVDWFVVDDKACMHVRLESEAMDNNDCEELVESGWVEGGA